MLQVKNVGGGTGGGSFDVVNGVINDFLSSGADIAANTFVEFVVGGSKGIFWAGNTFDISAVLLDSTHVMVCYRGNYSYGNSIILTISGTDITKGTATVFNSSYTCYISAVKLDSTHVMVCYRDEGNGNYGTAQVLTVSGTSITAGTETVFKSVGIYNISAVMLDSTHVMVCYRDSGNSSYGTAQVLTVSGTSITTGAETVYYPGSSYSISAVMLDSTHVMVCTYNASNGIAQLLTVSGTSITAGTTTVFNDGTTDYISAVKLDSTHVMVCYQDGRNSSYGTAQVLTVSGTSITAGTETVFNTGITTKISAVMLDSTHVMVCYILSNGYGITRVLTISGTSITVGPPIEFNEIGTDSLTSLMLDSTHVMVCYQDIVSGTARIIFDHSLAIKSTNRIQGLTKTKCTSTVAGKVWTL